MADVVNTSVRLWRSCGKRDRLRNVLHISPRLAKQRNHRQGVWTIFRLRSVLAAGKTYDGDLTDHMPWVSTSLFLGLYVITVAAHILFPRGESHINLLALE